MKLVFLTGDGIGPEISDATINLMEHIKAERKLTYDLQVRSVGLSALKAHGTTLPKSLYAEVSESEGFILAPLSTYQYPSVADGGINPSSEFRTKLDLYSNYRPCKAIGGEDSLRSDIDLIVVRENTEGFYACRSMHQGAGEFMPDQDNAFAIRKISRSASRRIAVAAFKLARERQGRRVTTIHKANVLKLSDGLFLNAVRDVAGEFPDVHHDELLVDAAAAMLIRDPSRFDVVLTTNLFGDILSNQAAEIAGGLGLAPSLNAGTHIAMAQAAHGSAPDIAGTNTANPAGLMLSVAMLFSWLGGKNSLPEMQLAAADMRTAIEQTLRSRVTCTRDMGGKLTTQEFGKAVRNSFDILGQ